MLPGDEALQRFVAAQTQINARVRNELRTATSFPGIRQPDLMRMPRVMAKVALDPEDEATRQWLAYDHPARCDLYVYDGVTEQFSARIGIATVHDRIGGTFAVEEDYLWVYNNGQEWQAIQENNVRLVAAKAVDSVPTGEMGVYRITVDEIAGVRTSYSIDAYALNITTATHAENERVLLFLDRQGVTDWLRDMPAAWPTSPITPGRWCAFSPNGGDGGSPADQFRWVAAVTPLAPGGTSDGVIVNWDGSQFVTTGSPVTLADPAALNCVLIDEVVLTMNLPNITGQTVIGSCGLRRHVRVDDAIIPGRSSYSNAAPPQYRNEGFGTLLDWNFDPTVDSWRYAQDTVNSSFQVPIYDPTLHSCVLPGEIVPVEWDRRHGRWLIEGGHGLVRRARLTADFTPAGQLFEYIEANEFAVWTLSKQGDPYTHDPGSPWEVVALNRLERALSALSWATLQWVPSDGALGEMNLWGGQWQVIHTDAEMIRVKLERISSPGELNHRYVIKDRLSGKILDDNYGNGIDPTVSPHGWRRMEGIEYEPATQGDAWFTGVRNTNPALPDYGAYIIGWTNEYQRSIECEDVGEPPPPPPPPPEDPWWCTGPGATCFQSPGPVPGATSFDSFVACQAFCAGEPPPPPPEPEPGWYCFRVGQQNGYCEWRDDRPPDGAGPFATPEACMQHCILVLP